MRLVLVRHAEALDRDPRIHRTDGDRQLSMHGRQVHLRMAAALARNEPHARRILTSPLVRARETAEITAAALGIRLSEILPLAALGDDFSTREILSRIGQLPGEETVVMVGHAPTLGDLALTLLPPGQGGEIEFEKSAMLCLEFTGPATAGKASIAWFLSPENLPPDAGTKNGARR
jgi:phosphohistidine phosphatase